MTLLTNYQLMDREDWGSLAAFAVVAEERSFTRAAARLGVSPSALSHTMRRLEERLRIQLLARSTRSVSTTEAGERLLARLRPAIEEISGAVEDLGRLLEPAFGPRPDHRVPDRRANGDRARPAPVRRRRYPEIVVEVLIDPGLTNIVAQRFDAGIRLGESLEKDVVAVPVTGPLRMAVVGSPQYFASHPSTVDAAGPASAPLHQLQAAFGRHDLQVGIREGAAARSRWASTARSSSTTRSMVLDAALAGVGLAYVIEDQVAPLLKAGALSRVLEDWCAPFPGVLPLLPGTAPGVACPRGVHRRRPSAGQPSWPTTCFKRSASSSFTARPCTWINPSSWNREKSRLTVSSLSPR